MRKRYRRAAVLPACILFLLCACTSNTREHDKPEEEQINTSREYSVIEKADGLIPREQIKVGIVQAGHESDWRIAVTQSCREAFSEENGYRLLFVDADHDPRTQVSAVRNFIQDQVDYIIIDPVSASGWTAVLKEAYHVGIPVFFINQPVDCDSRYYTAWFGPDYVCEGMCAGRWLQGYLDETGRSQETIQIAAINGTPGTSAQLGRTEGFAEYLEKNENWELLAEESGDFTESGGRRVMEEYLERFAHIDVLLCQNDNEALGACRALEEAGISYGKTEEQADGGSERVIVLSFDASEAGLNAVLDGKIQADFECSALAPLYAAAAIRRLEAGENLMDKAYYLPEGCFTCEENPGVLFLSDGVKRMKLVTEEVLEHKVNNRMIRHFE